MSDDDVWTELHHDAEAGVRVATITADTHGLVGQEFLADPLSAIQRHGDGDVDDSWTVQLHVVNADIPSGPLPLPDQIPAQPGDAALRPWVIRKIIIIIICFIRSRLAIVIVRRFDPDDELTRQNVLASLERSRSA
jgi:hypothetical protein